MVMILGFFSSPSAAARTGSSPGRGVRSLTGALHALSMGLLTHHQGSWTTRPPRAASATHRRHGTAPPSALAELLAGAGIDLLVEGWRVQHVFHDGRLAEHPVTSGAIRVADHVVYGVDTGHPESEKQAPTGL